MLITCYANEDDPIDYVNQDEINYVNEDNINYDNEHSSV